MNANGQTNPLYWVESIDLQLAAYLLCFKGQAGVTLISRVSDGFGIGEVAVAGRTSPKPLPSQAMITRRLAKCLELLLSEIRAAQSSQARELNKMPSYAYL